MSAIKGKVFAVDMDGTLAENAEFWKGEHQDPKGDIIDIINDLYDVGAVIIIHTSRREVDRIITEAWLRDNKVKYHALVMEKVKADYYIDDKAVNIKNIWQLQQKIFEKN